MAKYVENYVTPVRKTRIEEYRRLARKVGKIYREHGALEFHECVADDVKPGKVTSFPQALQLKRSEVVVVSWIVYKSRSHRDRVNKEVMNDPRLASMHNPKTLPFDAKRMFWGGFKSIVSL